MQSIEASIIMCSSKCTHHQHVLIDVYMVLPCKPRRDKFIIMIAWGSWRHGEHMMTTWWVHEDSMIPSWILNGVALRPCCLIDVLISGCCMMAAWTVLFYNSSCHDRVDCIHYAILEGACAASPSASASLCSKGESEGACSIHHHVLFIMCSLT